MTVSLPALGGRFDGRTRRTFWDTSGCATARLDRRIWRHGRSRRTAPIAGYACVLDLSAERSVCRQTSDMGVVVCARVLARIPSSTGVAAGDRGDGVRRAEPAAGQPHGDRGGRPGHADRGGDPRRGERSPRREQHADDEEGDADGRAVRRPVGAQLTLRAPVAWVCGPRRRLRASRRRHGRRGVGRS